MKLSKQQLKQIIKEELEIVLEAESMSPDDPDYEAVANAIMSMLNKLPGGPQHSGMMLKMMPSFKNDLYSIAVAAVENHGVPQHADYILEKVVEKIR